MATSTCSTDCLAVNGVGAVSGNKNTREFSARCTINLLQVAYLVGIEPLLEDVGIGLVADCKEESVDGNIYQLFVGFTLSLDQVGTFDTIFTIESQGVVLK